MVNNGDGTFSSGEDRKMESGSLVSCACCYDDLLEDNMFQCDSNQGHTVCGTCVCDYFIEQLDGKNSTDFECFVVEDCKHPFSERTLAKALPEDLKERADRAIHSKSVQEVEGIWTCKVCHNSFSVDRKYATQFCKGCNEKEYCTFCCLPAHSDKSCKEVQDEGNSQREPRHVAEEAMAEVVIRSCPKCQAQFLKDEGCNRMKCATAGCDIFSGYLCKQKIEGYEHFCQHSDRKSPDQRCPDHSCTKMCTLWTTEDIMKTIEKGWMVQAGRLALEEHGLMDHNKIDEILNSLSTE